MKAPTQLTDEKKLAVDFFERRADHYATERERTAYFQAQLKIVDSMLGEASGGRLLDVGCAAGGEIPTFRTRNLSVVGMDIAPRMLQYARQRFMNDPEVEFFRADVDRLPFRDHSMDYVVSLGVFEFLADYKPAVVEIGRVLRPGGLAIFAIPSRVSQCEVGERLLAASASPVWRAIKRLVRNARAAPTRPVFRRNPCVPWKFRTLLRSNGFETRKDYYSNFFLFPFNRIPPLDARVAEKLEPLCSIPLLRTLASVYMISARKL